MTSLEEGEIEINFERLAYDDAGYKGESLSLSEDLELSHQLNFFQNDLYSVDKIRI